MEQEHSFESPVNVCLKQGKRLKVISRLRKDALAQGSVEFEHEYKCIDENEQQNP